MANYIIPSQFTPYSPADATQMNANFTELATLLNSTGLDSTGLSPNAVVTAKIVDEAVTSSKLVDGAVIIAKLADTSVTQVKLLDTVEEGATSSSSFSTTSTTPVQVNTSGGTHVTTSITTTGRPVLVKVQPSSAVDDGRLLITNNNLSPKTGHSGSLYLYRDGVSIANWAIALKGSSGFPSLSSSLPMFLDVVASGAHTYSLWISVDSSDDLLYLKYVKLIAVEL